METKQAISDKTSDKSKRLIPVDEVLKGIDFCKARYSEKGDNELPPILVKFAVQILDILRTYIEQLQTTNSAPVVHGYWFFTEYEYFDCSECGFVYYNGCECTREAREMLRNGDAYKYCPNCGAKMDGGASG